MRCAIYTRLSLERDANAENCAIQEAERREYAEAQGWDVVAVSRLHSVIRPSRISAVSSRPTAASAPSSTTS